MLTTKAARQWATVGATLVLATGPLAGCGGGGEDEQPQEFPADAVRLKQNIPTPVGDYTVVAINIDGDEAALSVEPPGEGHENVPIAEGETLTVAGLSLEILAVEEDGPGEDEPTLPDGYVVVLPGLP